MSKEIYTAQGDKIIVDDEDFIFLSSKKWSTHNGRYAYNYYEGGFMHRVIMGLTSNNKKLFVDHINHNTFDNRKENLRIVTNKQNDYNRRKDKRNKSGYKGVYIHSYISKKTGDKVIRYVVQIEKDGKKYSGGKHFYTAEEAALKYNELAKELFGEYAYLNEIKTVGRYISNKKYVINKHNKTGYVGVRERKYVSKTTNKISIKYIAYIQKDGKRYTSKVFKTKNEAAQWYNDKAVELFGENAYLNKIE